MKLKVLEAFKDKYTDEVYPVGKILDVKKERGEELLKTPYVEVESKKDETTKKDTKKETENK